MAKVYVYNRRTGRKTPHPVPEAWLRIFPDLRMTPKQRAALRGPTTKGA